MKGAVTQIDEPDQSVVVLVEHDYEDDYVALLVFFEDTRKDPNEVVLLSATGAERLCHALVDAAGQARGKIVTNEPRGGKDASSRINDEHGLSSVGQR
jgi:hypothetical protein